MSCSNRLIISLVAGLLVAHTGTHGLSFESPLSPIALPEIIQPPARSPKLLLVASQLTPATPTARPAAKTAQKPPRRVYWPYDWKIERLNDQQ